MYFAYDHTYTSQLMGNLVQTKDKNFEIKKLKQRTTS